MRAHDEWFCELDNPEPVFDEGDCICDDHPGEHDDGFGCTVPDCPCLAGWSW